MPTAQPAAAPASSAVPAGLYVAAWTVGAVGLAVLAGALVAMLAARGLRQRSSKPSSSWESAVGGVELSTVPPKIFAAT